MKTLSVVIAAILIIPQICLAETIYLRNGKKVEGKIIEEGSYYVTIMKDGFPSKYYRDEIKQIGDSTSEEDIEIDDFASDLFGDINMSKVELINKLMDLTGVKKNMQQRVERILIQTPKDNREKMTDAFNVSNIMDILIPIYDKYYTQEELVDLVNFYESEVGLKYIKTSPQVTTEALKATMEYFQEKFGS